MQKTHKSISVMNVGQRLIVVLGILFWGMSFAVVAENNSIVEDGHFKPIWYGENGTGHMNIYVIGATLDGNPLVAGDEIAVCSGDICVGSGKLTSQISEGNIETFASIIASMDDGTGNGFVVGDTIVFKVWDVSAQEEYFAASVIYRNDLNTWRDDGKYESGASSFVTLDVQSVSEQRIQLISGWNVVSSSLEPQDVDMSAVMAGLIDEGVLLKVKDQSGNTLEDWGELGGWNNNIGDFDVTQGYRVYVSQDCELVIKGYPVELPMDINLEEGWNTIAFPYGETVDGSSILKTLMASGAMIKAKDEEGNSIEYWGEEEGWINNIGVFEPGKGYDIKVEQDAVLTIGGYYLKSQKMVMFELQPVHFILGYDGNGVEHMNVNITSFAGLGLEAGDEIGLFDGDLCVGVVKLTSAHIDEGKVSIVASKGSLGEKNGFISGNEIKIMVWQERVDRELEMIPEVISGELVFEENESVFVRINTATPTKKISFNKNVKLYPNPANEWFNVSLTEELQQGSVLSVVDLSGRIIEERIVENAIERFDVSQYQAGLYLVRLINDHKKMVWKLNVK